MQKLEEEISERNILEERKKGKQTTEECSK